MSVSLKDWERKVLAKAISDLKAKSDVSALIRNLNEDFGPVTCIERNTTKISDKNPKSIQAQKKKNLYYAMGDTVVLFVPHAIYQAIDYILGDPKIEKRFRF
jgi:hypothetical protein